MKRLRLTTLVAGLALLVPVMLPAQQLFPPDQDLQLMLDYLVEDHETPGIVLGIREADGSTRIMTAGSGGEGRRPLGPRSVFEIGSINKTFTGALLALAVQKGEVALEDPVRKYLPAHVAVPSRNGREITLLDLATHTSGLPRLPDNHRPSDMANPYADYTIQTMYEFLSNHTLRRDPGAEGEYSNLAFGLLGHALARAAGTSYQELVRGRILEPLGMTMTSWAVEGDVAEWTTRGHADGEPTSFWFGTEAIYGAGGLRSSLADMMKYLEANVGPADSDLERAMRTAQRYHRPMQDREDWGMGLGWQVQDLGDRTFIGHGGGTGGYSTYMAFDPASGIGFVMMANTSEFGDDLGRDFLRRGLPLPVADIALPRSTLEAYAGAYEMTPGRFAYVRLEDGGFLTLQVPGDVRFRLYADSESEFVVKRAPWRLAFERDTAGRVTGMELDMAGQQRRAARVDRKIPPPGVAAGNVAVELTDAEMARYVGHYTLTAGPRTIGIRIWAEDGRLMGQPDGQGTSPLLYQGDDTFLVVNEPAIRLSFTLENGRAEGITLHQNGRQLPGTRTP